MAGLDLLVLGNVEINTLLENDWISVLHAHGKRISSLRFLRSWFINGRACLWWFRLWLERRWS